jgi:tRNA A37 N6-isopentenylltransferase MiaA
LSKEELFDKLSKRDSAVADKIGINNVKRLVRALQILDENKSLVNKNKPVFDYKVIVAAKPREQLYIDANKNVKAMINNG